MRCPHCGNEFKQIGPSPGGLVICPACQKGFPDPTGQFHPPKATGAGAAGLGVVAMVIAGVAICGLLGCVAGLVALLLPAVQAARGAANRMACQNNLKQIALAMHNYHDTHKVLPAQAILDEDGRAMHSWRTALLPFLEQPQLFELYNFDEPWDSPHNQMVGQQFVQTYACPGHNDGASNETSYFVVYGDETMFGPNRWTKFSEVPDGLSNTIMIVESNSMHVPWSQPVDIPLDQMQFRLNAPDQAGVSSPHPLGVNVAFGDGAVKFLSDSMDEQTFRYALIKDDGTPIALP